VTQPADAHTVVLLCRVGTHLCALPVEHVVETMRPLAVVPLAGVPLGVSGVSLIRGFPVPVIDAGCLFGIPGPRQVTRFVTIKVDERRAALAVDSVVGVRTLPVDSSRELAPLLQTSDAGVVSTIGTLDANLLLVLQGARLVPASIWKAIEAAEAIPRC
jgi:purine-binding chemotaxis protein CheW